MVNGYTNKICGIGLPPTSTKKNITNIYDEQITFIYNNNNDFDFKFRFL